MESKANVTGPLVGNFNSGRALTTPGTAETAGGGNIKKPMPVLSAGQGSRLNLGRSNRKSPNQVHYNGKTTLPSKISNTRP